MTTTETETSAATGAPAWPTSARHQIVIEIDETMLSSYTAAHLAMLWHVAQANPADGFETSEPGELAERIGREIIRRWLSTSAEPELYHHQGRHYYWKQLGKFAKWDGAEWVARSDADAR